MKHLKKGPEIKLSDLRVPRFLVDLYYDLDERHLIPVVVILLAGIVALPIAFGHSSGSQGEGAEAEAGVAAPAVPGGTVVAAATPGLRNYRHRLAHLHPKDPFKSPYAAPGTAAGAQAGAASAAASSESVVAATESVAVAPEGSATPSGPTPSPTPSGPTPRGGREGSGGTPAGTHGSHSGSSSKPTYLNYAIDVRVNPVSGSESKASGAKPYVRRELPELSMLPSRGTPALTYMGPSGDAKKALMVVSSDVTGLFGDSRCVLGSDSCQLLALEPGVPETVVFGPHARTYRIQLLRLVPVKSHGLDRAPLGKPK